ncbi:MAG: hypothetical protein Q4B87_00915 [Candidatus Saccharibacteria bacterium]|nr:hypothetical protein [Candidatus Saccharibacteria bacterium]
MVYRFQKRDRLRGAATTLLLEIQQAERAVAKAREYIRSGDLNVNLHILQSDTWDQNKYLFTKVLDKDEWDSITGFYDEARLLDASIEYAKKCFNDDVEQIRVNKQRIFADIARETVTALSLDDGTKRESIIRVMQSRMSTFDNLYMSQQYLARYNPQKNFDDAKKCIEDFSNISTTSVGQKIKKISNSRRGLLWL